MKEEKGTAATRKHGTNKQKVGRVFSDTWGERINNNQEYMRIPWWNPLLYVLALKIK